MREITVNMIMSVARRYLFLLILVPALVAAGYGYYQFTYVPPSYVARTTFHVDYAYQDAIGNIRYETGSSGYMNDYIILMRTPEFNSAVAEAMGETYLTGVRIVGSAVNNSRMFDVTVTGSDPGYCMRVANTLTEVLPDYIRRTFMLDNMSITMQPALSSINSDRYRSVALAGGIALALIFGLLLLLEMLNTRVRNDEDVETELKLPLLAQIGKFNAKSIKPSESTIGGENIYDKGSSMLREEIQTLDTNIRFAMKDKPYKSLIITSSVPGEGKTTLSVLIACCVAKQDRRVLLIDGDFRHPSVARALGCSISRDLVECINQTLPLGDCVTHTSIANLDIIGSVKENSAGFVFKSEAFLRFFETAAAEYDLVMFDSPPLGLFSEASQLASLADAVLMTMRYNKTPRLYVLSSINQLKKASANLLGGIINVTDYRREHDYRYYGYYKYYDRYGKLKRKRRR